MKITKLGHCCLLIDTSASSVRATSTLRQAQGRPEELERATALSAGEEGLRILTDPGSYSVEEQKNVKDIDVVLITHEHSDHLHVDSLKTILVNNSKAKVFTNGEVGKILEKEKIAYEVLEHGNRKEVDGVSIEGFGEHHAEMYRTQVFIPNTGYMIANKLFYPGDALTQPPKAVSVLALPVAGPWLKLSEAIDYAIAVKPKKCFPVHDGILKNIGSTDRIPAQVLSSLGIEFKPLELNKEYEY